MKTKPVYFAVLIAFSSLFSASAANYRYEWVPTAPPAWLLATAPYNGAWADVNNPTPIINERATWGEIIITDTAYNDGAFGDFYGGLVAFNFVEYGADGVTPFANFNNSAYSIDHFLQIEPIHGTLVDGPGGHKIFETLTGAYEDYPYDFLTVGTSTYPLRRGVWVGLGYLHYSPITGLPEDVADVPLYDPNLVWIGSDPQYYGEWVYRGIVDSNPSVPEPATTASLLLLSSLALAFLRRRC